MENKIIVVFLKPSVLYLSHEHPSFLFPVLCFTQASLCWTTWIRPLRAVGASLSLYPGVSASSCLSFSPSLLFLVVLCLPLLSFCSFCRCVMDVFRFSLMCVYEVCPISRSTWWGEVVWLRFCLLASPGSCLTFSLIVFFLQSIVLWLWLYIIVV